MPRRTLLVCPGRGSYDRHALGQLNERRELARLVLDACDAWRRGRGQPTVRELDAAERFRTKHHVAGEHASLLTAACSLADLADLDRERYEVVGVTGNSMGWYTALAAANALPLESAIRLVDTMGAYQEGNVLGGQLLFPIADSEWRLDPARVSAVESALTSTRAAGHQASWSIRLGGYAVLGADAEGLGHLKASLPEETRGPRTFPVQIPLHSAFHTHLMQATSERAFAELGDLPFSAPSVPLIDGTGQVHRPRWCAPDTLARYTLGEQVVGMYDYSRAVVSALHHTGAEVVVILGPGNSLGAPTAQILVADGWRGARDRKQLDAIQASDAPLLLSFGVDTQRERLV